MTAFSCQTDCTSTCVGGTCDATRSIETPASGGGSCAEADDLTRTGYPCPGVTAACAPSSTDTCDDSAVTAAANVTVSASLTLPSAAWPDDETEAAFAAALKASAAVAGGVACDAVTVGTPARVAAASSRRRLLAGTVTVDVAAAFQVGDTDATKNAATDKLVAFTTKALYMTDWLLPAEKRSSANAAAGTATVAASAGAALSCPASKTYEEALVLSDAGSHEEAARALNDLLACAYESGTAAALNAMADEFNVLGYSVRKAAEPDVELSELYYKRALQIDPAHQGATGYLGELYVQKLEFGLARESLDKLKLMCPPPNDCPALGVLRYAMSVAGAIEGAFVRDVAWNDCFDLACSPMNITVGDSLNFVYSEAHDVVKVADAAAFETCAAGETVGAASAGAGVERKFESVGVEYFVCSQGSHCANGQKMVVNVHSARTTPSAGGEAPSYSLQAEVESGAREGVRGAALALVAAAVVALVAVA